MASGPITSWQIDGKQWKQWETLFFGAPKSLQMLTAAMKLNGACSLEESYNQPRQHIKKQRHDFTNKGPSSQRYSFSSSHVWMWELDHKESWVPKNWCFWTVVLNKFLESPLDWKEIKSVNPKGNSPEYSLEGLMLKLKLQYFGHLMRRADSLEKTLCWERLKAGLEGDELVGWHHWLDGHEFEQALGVGVGQGSLVCCSSRGCEESDTTERLN